VPPIRVSGCTGRCETSRRRVATGNLVFDAQGNPNAVFVIKTGSTLTTAASAVVQFANGAQACNVYWQIGSSATFGATNTFAGTVAALTTITVGAGGTFAGPLLAHPAPLGSARVEA
jgi:beta-lactamase class A